MDYPDDEDESGDEAGPEIDEMPALGHGGEGTELVPRMIQALAGKEVIGVSAGVNCGGALHLWGWSLGEAGPRRESG